MSFQTVSEFFLMGGHALYVWLCYGVGLFILLFMYIQPILARKAILQDLFQRQRREAQHNKISSNLNTQDNNGQDITGVGK